MQSSIFTKRGSSLLERESIVNRDCILWVLIIRWQQKQGAELSAQINNHGTASELTTYSDFF